MLTLLHGFAFFFRDRNVAVAIALFNSPLRVIIFSALDSRQVLYFGTGTGE